MRCIKCMEECGFQVLVKRVVQVSVFMLRVIVNDGTNGGWVQGNTGSIAQAYLSSFANLSAPKLNTAPGQQPVLLACLPF